MDTKGTVTNRLARFSAKGTLLALLALLCHAAQAQPGGDAAPTQDTATLEPFATDADATAAQPDVPVTRFELQLEIDDLLEADDFAAAAALGERLLELARAEFGEDSTAYADTLLRVADAQKLDANYADAENNGLRAVEIYREQDGPFSDTLVGPYLAVGDIYQAAEDYLNAMPAYEEARNISRRANGLLNPDQIEILERLSTTAERMGEMADAQKYQEDALTLVERSNEPYSPEVVAAVLRYGAWLRDRNMFMSEQTLYSRTERAINEQYGENSIERVPLLRARANSFRWQALNHPLGIGALQLASEILALNPNALTQAEVDRDIGDWEAAFNEFGTDGNSYLAAWQSLAEVENGAELRDEWFGEYPARPVLLAVRSQRGFSTDPEAASGRLIIRFTVLPSGLTTDVEVTDADPPDIAEAAFIRQFRASRFRPVIRDGRLTSVRRAYSAEFRYDPKRYD